jgi:transposase-like protein
MGKPHRHFTAQQKVSILREHLLDGTPISDVCEKHQLALTIFYRWQKAFFENGAAAFEKDPNKGPTKEEKRIAQLEAKLKKKNEVLSELMEEHIALKKELGEL